MIQLLEYYNILCIFLPNISMFGASNSWRLGVSDLSPSAFLLSLGPWALADQPHVLSPDGLHRTCQEQINGGLMTKIKASTVQWSNIGKIRKFNDPSSNINDKDQCYDSHINCPANIMWETYNDCANISWIRQPKTRMMKVGAMGPGQSIYIYTYILYTQQNGKIIASRTRFMDLDVQIKRLGTVPNKLDRN